MKAREKGLIEIRESVSSETSDLVHSESGAILIVGLFMILGLIGSLWFLLGIGATLATKEKMQLAADAAAFSSAAVHARDMNFVVGINLIMFMLAAVWLLLCVTYTVMQIVTIYTWIVGFVSCLVGCEGLPDAAAMEELTETMGDIKDAYKDALEFALPALSAVQTIVQGAADPEAVILTAIETARHDDGTTMGGAGSVDIVTEAAFSQQIGGRLGMPIENQKNSALCSNASNWVIGYAETLIDQNPIVKTATNMTAGEKAALKIGLAAWNGSHPLMNMAIEDFEKLLDQARQMVTKLITTTYCSGGVWDKAGPKRMSRPDANKPDAMEKNASDYMQVYGLAMPTGSVEDNDAEHKIGIASQTKVTHTDAPLFFTYAQAEYFFDCQGKWDSGSCNSISDQVKNTGIDASMYRMQWRARLVRVHTPKNIPGSDVTNALTQLLTSAATMKRLQDSGPLAPAYRAAFSLIPANVLGFINQLPAASYH